MKPEERTKKIGKYLILLTGRIYDVWTKNGYSKQSIYEVSVHLKQKGNVIETSLFDNPNRMANREKAITSYRNMRTVSDVHKFLYEINTTERPLNHYDRRLRY